MWAKLGTGEPPSVHLLACHLLDAGAVAGALWEHCLGRALQERLAAAFGCPPGSFGPWVSYITALHDLGKATPGFQSLATKRRPDLVARLRDAGLGCAPTPGACRHDVLTEAVLRCLESPRLTGARQAGEVGRLLGRMLAGHHGTFAPPGAARQAVARGHCGNAAWREAQQELLTFLAEHWRVAALPPLRNPAPDAQWTWRVLAGLVTVADWLASCEEYFPHAGLDADLAAYAHELPERTATALAKAGWTEPPVPLLGRGFREVFGELEPRAVQVQMGRTGEEVASPALVLLEAPTGLGKTEAALDLARALLGRLAHRGLYAALPTQATSNQMFERVRDFLRGAFGLGRINLQLAHGQAMLHPDAGGACPSAVAADYDGRAAGDRAERPAVVAEEWFRSSKRALLAPYAVGTVDQALLGVLQTRHSFVRLFALANKVVVLDEVHAYDTYTSEHLMHLLRWLRRIGCSVLVLTATLPDERRRKLLEAYTGRRPPEDLGRYPRMIVAAADGYRPAEAVKGAPERSVLLEPGAREPAALARALREALEGGGCAAVICNTVGRAQEVYRAMRDSDWTGELRLLHARFPFAQRQSIEEAVVRGFGKEGWKEGRPGRAILVATQIIEQSLDLDFDLMVTDLAPVDLILQRAGRLHRHAEADGKPTARPAGLQRPRLWLARPDTDTDGVPDFGPDARIYQPYVLLRTYLALLEDSREAIRSPGDVEDLIECVYGEAEPAGLTKAWRERLSSARAELEAARTGDRGQAQAAEIPLPDDPDGPFDSFDSGMPDDEEAYLNGTTATTRKCRRSVRLICLHRTADGLSLDRGATRPVDLGQAPRDRSVLRELLLASVSVSDPRVVRYVRANERELRPASWRRASLLRHCIPVTFADGRFALAGGDWLVLDEELGLYVSSRRNGPQGED